MLPSMISAGDTGISATNILKSTGRGNDGPTGAAGDLGAPANQQRLFPPPPLFQSVEPDLVDGWG